MLSFPSGVLWRNKKPPVVPGGTGLGGPELGGEESRHWGARRLAGVLAHVAVKVGHGDVGERVRAAARKGLHMVQRRRLPVGPSEPEVDAAIAQVAVVAVGHPNVSLGEILTLNGKNLRPAPARVAASQF